MNTAADFKSSLIPAVEAAPGDIYDAELEQGLMEANAALAEKNRLQLDQLGIQAVDFTGAVGSGKTTLICRLAERLKPRMGIAILNGDDSAGADYDKLAERGVPVLRLATAAGCHLDASLVARGLSRLDLDGVKMIFIENIGNLIRPADFPLGAHQRVTVVNVIGGSHIVKKHPRILDGAGIVVINKIDLAGPMGVSVSALTHDIRVLQPNMKIINTNSKNPAGANPLVTALLGIERRSP